MKNYQEEVSEKIKHFCEEVPAITKQICYHGKRKGNKEVSK